jgi:hypothetical protein
MSQPSPRARTSLLSAHLSGGGDAGSNPRGLISPRSSGGRLVPPTRRASAETPPPESSLDSRADNARAPRRRYTFNDFEDTDDSASDRNTMDSLDSNDIGQW